MKNKWITVALLLLTGCLLGACSKKVVTVADMQVEEGQDTSYIEMKELQLKSKEEGSGKEKVQYCAVLIPAGYHQSSDIPGMYIHEKSPLDSSNIYYSVSEGQENQKLTETSYQEMIEEAYKESGEKTKMMIQSFEEIDLDGVPTYKIRSSFETDDHVIEQLAYVIMADQTYTVTYSQSADDELMADFEVSDGEIKLVRQSES